MFIAFSNLNFILVNVKKKKSFFNLGSGKDSRFDTNSVKPQRRNFTRRIWQGIIIYTRATQPRTTVQSNEKYSKNVLIHTMGCRLSKVFKTWPLNTNNNQSL